MSRMMDIDEVFRLLSENNGELVLPDSRGNPMAYVLTPARLSAYSAIPAAQSALQPKRKPTRGERKQRQRQRQVQQEIQTRHRGRLRRGRA